MEKENTKAGIRLDESFAEQLLGNDAVGMILEEGEAFRSLMTYYRCAIMEVETKFNVLDKEFSLTYDRNPIQTIKSRLKSPEVTSRSAMPSASSASICSRTAP